MMYRRHAAQHSTKGFDNIATKAEATGGMTAAFFAMLHKLGIFEQAERENRRYTRVAKRDRCYMRNAAAGLNGEQAIARRRRQIAAGSLTVSNGLVVEVSHAG